MSKTLTATDRKALIRLASSMDKGSDERRAILAGLGTGKKASSVDFFGWVTSPEYSKAKGPGVEMGWAESIRLPNGAEPFEWVETLEGHRASLLKRAQKLKGTVVSAIPYRIRAPIFQSVQHISGEQYAVVVGVFVRLLDPEDLDLLEQAVGVR